MLRCCTCLASSIHGYDVRMSRVLVILVVLGIEIANCKRVPHEGIPVKRSTSMKAAQTNTPSSLLLASVTHTLGSLANRQSYHNLGSFLALT